ncbi:MAG: hypothetical protein AAF569_04065 [Pseudomonadota bacterium]
MEILMLRREPEDERQKQRACYDLRDRIETKIGQIELLEDEIRILESEIPQLENEIEEARDDFREIAAEFGPTQVPFLASSRVGNTLTLLEFGTRQYDTPEARDVESALVEYQTIESRNNSRISDIESDIRRANPEIRRIQFEKEDLVGKLRHNDCF